MIEYVTFENKEYATFNTNLYKRNGIYYKLFATGISTNGCWLNNAKLVEIKDVIAETGEYDYGSIEIIFEPCGTIPSHHKFIHTTKKLCQEKNKS